MQSLQLLLQLPLWRELLLPLTCKPLSTEATTTDAMTTEMPTTQTPGQWVSKLCRFKSFYLRIIIIYLLACIINIASCITPAASPSPVSITVSPITSSGTGTAGENYSLECTVTVTGSNDQPTTTWLMGPMDNMITSGVVTTGSMSTLTFNPLAASDAGTYTCRATLGSAVDSESTTIAVHSEWIIITWGFIDVLVS